MKPQRTPCRARFFLLFAGLFLQAPLAAAQPSAVPSQPQLTPDLASRLSEAAGNPGLKPWQRDLMLLVARDRVAPAAVEPSSARSSLSLRTAATAADHGGWIAVPPPTGRTSPTAIYDPVRDRMVVFGGLDGGFRNDVWALSLAGSPAWSDLTPTGTPPSGRFGHTAIYDPVRDRMVVFGGLDGDTNLHDVWALSLAGSPAWSELTPAGTPPSERYWHTAVYDPLRDRMVVFGGFDGSYRRDVWALSLAGSPAWSALAPTGTLPPSRYRHTAIYDPVRDRMVMFGGLDGVTAFDDVWALPLTGSLVWSALAPVGGPPPTLYSPSAVYDPVRDRMVVFGGYDNSSARDDVWALSLAGSPTWGQLAPAGTLPAARYIHAALYDPVRDRMVVFGGYDGVNARNDVWALPLAGSSDWSELAPPGSPPSARYFHTAIYDPVRDAMVVFGGFDGTASHYRRDAWSLSFAGIPAWSVFAAAGPPPARIWHTAIYDPVRDRMVVFGGFDGTTLRNDVWALSLAGSPAWNELTPSGVPPTPRYSPAAFYDPVRDRMVVFGGNDGGALRSDVWALSLAGTPAWSALAPVGSPPAARYQHTAIYDSSRDRMVVFGGYDGSGPRDDVWALSLAGSPAWSALAPDGSPPSARYQHTAFYDPVRDRMVVFGGNDDTSLRNDVWALSLAGSPAWSALAPTGSLPPRRSDHPVIYDRARDRMVVFGGYGGGYRNDVWALVWGTSGSGPGGNLPPVVALAPPRPNPSPGETFVDFALGVPARVVLDVFDAQGRRVHRIANGEFPVGRHFSTWQGDDEDGRAMESGVYFIRIQVGGVQATRRIVRIR